MRGSPYRIPAPRAAADETVVDETINVDLFLCGQLVWSMSIVRLGIALRTHEPFVAQSEPALAALVVLVLPWLARRSLRDRIQKARGVLREEKSRE